MNLSDATTPTPTVIAEILAGEGMTLSDAARLCPASRGQGRVSPTTLLRWVTDGAPRHDGTLVRLEAARYGRRWLVSRSSLARFIQSLTPMSTPPPTTSASTAPNPKRVKKATEKLVASGA